MLGRKRKKEWKREEKRKGEEEEDEGLEIGRERQSFTTATVSNHNKHLTFYGVHPGNLPIQQQNRNIQSIHQSVNHHINSSIQCCCFLFPRVCLLRFARLGLFQPPAQKRPLGFHLSEVTGDSRLLQTV
jgi:hypothetical protein